MSWPSSKVWGQISRPLTVTDEDGNALGTVAGVLRGRGERELQGGASMYDALAVFRASDLGAASIDLRRNLRIGDPEVGSTFNIESVRHAFGPRQGRTVKADLIGLQ